MVSTNIIRIGKSIALDGGRFHIPEMLEIGHSVPFVHEIGVDVKKENGEHLYTLMKFDMWMSVKEAEELVKGLQKSIKIVKSNKEK